MIGSYGKDSRDGWVNNVIWTRLEQAKHGPGFNEMILVWILCFQALPVVQAHLCSKDFA